MVKRMHRASPNKTARRLLVCASLLLSLLVWSIPISAGNFQVITLEPGKRLSRELAGGKAETFTIPVAEKQYFRVVVEQQGIEVTVTLSDSTRGQDLTREPIVQIWSASGARGPLYISEIADKATDYTLQVKSLEKAAGSYTITLESPRTRRPEDGDRVTAERALAKGQRLQKEADGQASEEAKKRREEAFNESTEAAKGFAALKDAHGEVRSWYLAGVIKRSLGQLDEAKESMTRALGRTPALAPNDWRLKATVTNDLGMLYARLHDEETARSYLKSALQIFESHGDQRGKASSSTNLGLSYGRTGEGREAIKLFEVSLRIRQLDNDKVNEIRAINNLGGAYQSLGEFRKALDYFEQALRIWEESKSRDLAAGLNNVGLIYEKLGLWQTAIDHYQKSLAVIEQGGPTETKPTTLYNLGELYSRLNDSSRALESYEKALTIQRELKNYSEEAKILAHIGTVHISQNNTQEALKYLEQVLRIPETHPNVKIPPRDRAYTLLGLGEVYRLQGKPREALQYFEQARKEAEDVADRQQESDAQQKLGETHQTLRDWNRAQESYEKALALRRQLEDRLGEATTLYHIANLKRDLNQFREAAEASAAALKQFEALRENIVSHQLRTSYFETTQQCFELYVDVKFQLYRTSSDVRHVEEAFTANEQAHARTLVDILAQASTLIRQGVNPAVLQKKQALLESLNSRANLRNALLNEKEVQQRAHDRKRTKENLQALTLTKGRLTDMAAVIKTLIAQIDDLDTQIRRESPKYAALTKPQTLNLQEIQSELLDDDTILLEYSLGDRRSFAFVVSSTSVMKAIELPKRAEIEPVARRLGSALRARNVRVEREQPGQYTSRIDKANAEYIEAASVLSKMVIEPVASLLGKKRVVVVADGALQLIPFAVLPVSPNSARAAATTPRLLIDDYEIVMLPSASVLGVQRRELKGRKIAPHAVAVLANPVFESSDERVRAAKRPASTQVAAVVPQEMKRPALPLSRDSRGQWVLPLPYSEKEAKAIEKVAPPGETMLALNFKASRSTMMNPALSQYRIVHLATHAVTDPDHPELSEIILSLVDENGAEQDGRVRLYEIYNLNLPAELVVISACDSGVGKQLKGEGLIALTRGFMYAGAARVVASLWKVDDTATAALMTEFYKEMFTNGRDEAAALRAAQLTVSKQKRWREPYFWAGFVLQGEWH